MRRLSDNGDEKLAGSAVGWMRTVRSPAALAAASLFVGSLAVFMLLQWRATSDGIDRTNDDLTSIEVLQSRLALSRAQLDELNLRMLVPLGYVDQASADASTEKRLETFEEELANLAAIASEIDSHDSEIAEFFDLMDEWGPSGPEADLISLYEGSITAHLDAAPDPSDPPSPLDSLTEAMWLDQAFTLTLHELSIAAYSPQDGSPLEDSPLLTSAPVEVFDLVTYATDFISSGGGQLGPDQSRPLYDGWIYIDVAEIHESEMVGMVDDLIASTDLWEADHWIASWAERDSLGAPPVALDRLVDATLSDVEQARTVLDARLSDRTGAIEDDLGSIENRESLFLVAGLVALAAAVALMAKAAAIIWRRSLALANMANTDPLTGLGNRNTLHGETEQLLADDRYNYHLVATIDLDRFKVANDTFGHAVGDRLLVRLAAGLNQIARSCSVEASTVVRLGGDEFLISLHSERPIDRGTLEHWLNQLRRQSIDAGKGANLVLEFSYGMAEAEGSPALDGLMDASDLATYEEKYARREARTEAFDAQVVDIT